MKTCKTRFCLFLLCFLAFIKPAFTEGLSFSHSFKRDYDHNDYTDDVFFKDKYTFSESYHLLDFNDCPLTLSSEASFYVYAGPFIKRYFSNEPDFFRQSPSYELKTSLTYGTVSERNNFKEGYLISFYPAYNYHFKNCKEATGDSESLSFSASYKHYFAYRFFGLNYEIAAFYHFNTSYINGTTNISTLERGLSENVRVFNIDGAPYQTKTPVAIQFFMDMPFHLFNTHFENYAVTRPLKIFRKLNLEFQAGPFIELSLIKTTKEIHGTDRLFNIKDGFYIAGLEAKVYPESFGNLSVRISAGFDVSRLIFKNNEETSWRNQKRSPLKFTLGVGSFI